MLKILFVSSEIHPFAKTGGLADVGCALPKALQSLGHQPIVFMPAYRSVMEGDHPIESTDIQIQIPVGNRLMNGSILQGTLPHSNVPIYFIEQHEYFDREGIYGGQSDYEDNCARFSFFSRAVLEAINVLHLDVDVIHCNDWQTGLIPALVRLQNRPLGVDTQTALIMTIHNLAYQGVFGRAEMRSTGLDWKHFNWQEMEFYGKLNLLKTGLVFADGLSTVSPTYANEIQTTEHGCGLESLLRDRKNDLAGIINGVDYNDWNPETDALLASKFSSSNWRIGKPQCKEDLQHIMGLPVKSDAPLIGIIGRLAEQKGWDLIIELMRCWLPDSEVQWAILGTGEARFEKEISELVQRFPERISAQLTFSNELAHKIEAGADMFLMPSRYEPCGLNQLYSLKYGTVPIVRATGGLKDSVTNADQEAVTAGEANGFSFSEYSAAGIQDAVHRAVLTYSEHQEIWGRIVETGMKQDWSWTNSARHYVDLYQSTLSQLSPKKKK